MPKKKKAQKRLPKMLYVFLRDWGDGEISFSAEPSISDLAQVGEKRIVGTYELVEQRQVSVIVNVK